MLDSGLMFLQSTFHCPDGSLHLFQEALDAAFPPDADANLIRGVSEGIFLADSTMKSAGFLQSTVGLDVRGHVRRAGILYRLHEMAGAGDLPFSSIMSKMPRGNWHWIELQSKNFTAHVCRTDAPEAFPDDTPTRQDERVTNQPDFFEDNSSVVPIKGYLAWLTFGIGDSGALGHLCWGMPKASEDVWLARTNVIRRAEMNEKIVPIERADMRAKVKFRDHIEETVLKKSSENLDTTPE